VDCLHAGATFTMAVNCVPEMCFFNDSCSFFSRVVQANSTCYGTMTKAQWYDKGTRAQKCYEVFQEQVSLGRVNSTAQGLDICNLNVHTDKMCKVHIIYPTACTFPF
jgi:hypothetical protein